MSSTQIDLSALASLVALFVPLLVTVLTKKNATDGLKAALNIVLNAVATVAVLVVDPTNGHVTWQIAVNTFVAALVTSLAAHHGVWKPTGVTGTVADATANVGVGSPPTVQTDQAGDENVLPC